MNIGMLWFDNDPERDLKTKVARAADYYRKKYGATPNLCFVHPSMLTGIERNGLKVDIKPNGSVLPHHFWIGINGRSE